MKSSRGATLVFILISILLTFTTACSLESPTKGGGVRILIEDTQEKLNSLYNFVANPTSAAAFDCFVVNVTGSGVIAESSLLTNCTSPTGMHGKGAGRLSKIVRRGNPIDMLITSGAQRTFDVYGAFPAPQECGGSSNSGNNNDSGGGFFLGRTVSDVTDNTTVSVPIAYSGASPDIVCSGDHGGGSFFVGNIFPYGGDDGGGWSFQVMGSGFISTSIVKVGSTSCTGGPCTCTLVNAGQMSCTMSSGIAPATYSITVDNQNGQTSTSGANFLITATGANVSTDANTTNIDFGSVQAGQFRDITITIANMGDTNATLAASPTITGDFSLQSSTCSWGSNLGPLSTCTLIVRFNPPSAGPSTHGSFSLVSAPGLNVTAMSGVGTP